MGNLTDTAGKALISGDVSAAVIGAYYRVYNELGHGFLEKVYANALAIEFRERGLSYVREAALTVFYRQTAIGDYRADFLVEQQVIVEVKAHQQIVDAHRRQLLHYLKGTTVSVGLLLNFGPEARFHREIFAWHPQLNPSNPLHP